MTDQQHRFALEFLELLPLKQLGDNVLDIGGGPGHQTAWLREHGVDACCVDLCPPTEDVPWVEADVHALPFPDRTVDAVWTHHAFEHLDAPLRALAEVNRVLRDGGWLLFTVPDTCGTVSSGHITRYDMALLVYHLAMCGFDVANGYLGKHRSHLRAAVRKIGPASMETSVTKLLPLLPKSCHKMVMDTGRFNLASLETIWLDGTTHRYG